MPAKRLPDLTGLRFGRLTVVGRGAGLSNGPCGVARSWDCLCDCGRHCDVRTSNLTHGKTQTCGCWRHPLNVQIGMRIGRLVIRQAASPVVRKSGYSEPTWQCECDCGAIVTRTIRTLNGGGEKSCGCYSKEQMRDLGRSRATHGESHTRLTPEYRIWKGILRRCTSRQNPAYPYYGGRGITVCPEWAADYTAFLRDMGRRPSSSHSIDRRDNDGPYSPENCRWATRREQADNRRNNVIVEIDGKRRLLADWANDLGVPITTVRQRIYRRGWNPARALTTPIALNKSHPRSA